jgi:NTE family protein
MDQNMNAPDKILKNARVPKHGVQTATITQSRPVPDEVRQKAERQKRGRPLPLPETVALVLQGGGALGSFQGGVYEALLAQNIRLDWVAGISIGAINAALIAGNPRRRALEKIRTFWDEISAGGFNFPAAENPYFSALNHNIGAMHALAFGAPGFFEPRMIPPPIAWPGTDNAVSFYDTTPLINTLNQLVDWDRLNDGPVRLSVGAVDVESGNFRYFDTQCPDEPVRIDARHIMASGALPPGFPPVEIDGRHYWDGGLVSNTPLAYVLEHQSSDLLVFQVDLFPAKGKVPQVFEDVLSREKDIRYSSRTRAVTDQYLRLRKEHEAIRAVLDLLPANVCDDPDVQRLRAIINENAVNIVHLIYKVQEWEGGARDYEFSRATMNVHWQQGQDAVAKVMKKGGVLAQNIMDGKTAAFDLAS